MVREYSQNNDVAMDDIAAALAVKLQGDKEFLLKEQPVDKRKERFNDKRGGRDFDDRGGRGGRDRGGRGGRGGRDENFQPYRLAVGKRQNVRPGSIVGALANEGGLSSKDFGRINIGAEHTIVELPKNLDPAVLDRLSDTRISGELIKIRKDHGAPGRGGFQGGGGGRQSKGGRKGGGKFRR